MATVAGIFVALGALLIAAGALTLHRSVGARCPRAGVRRSGDQGDLPPSQLRLEPAHAPEPGARDPRLPAAYVGLANSYLLLREYGSLPDADAYARAEATAQAAVALAPDCAEAHRALAFIAFWWRQDRDAARREFGRSLALKPDDPLTHHWLANALLANGEAEPALREIDRARDLDPTATAILANRGMVLYVTGHRAEGLAGLRTLARDQPGVIRPHLWLADIALFEGRPDEFLRESFATERLRADAAGLAAVARWRSVASGKVTVTMLGEARQLQRGWFQTARLAALAGRSDEAKDALARSCATREPAAVGAPGDLWLSRALTPADIAERCGHASLL